MGAGAEELKGERGIAVLGELVVVQDVRGAEQDCVAVGGRESQQRGEAVVDVAGVGTGHVGGVAGASGVGVSRAAGDVEEQSGCSVDSKLGASARTPGARVRSDGGPGARRTVRPSDFLVAECRADCCLPVSRSGAVTSRVVSEVAAAAASSVVVTTRVDTPRAERSSATARLP